MWRIQKAEEQSDIFNIFQKNILSKFSHLKTDSRSIWKAINTLTTKVIVKELPPDKLNSHFANISDTVITNDKSKLNDLSF